VEQDIRCRMMTTSCRPISCPCDSQFWNFHCASRSRCLGCRCIGDESAGSNFLLGTFSTNALGASEMTEEVSTVPRCVPGSAAVEHEWKPCPSVVSPYRLELAFEPSNSRGAGEIQPQGHGFCALLD
jgi:hypothetical protein